MKAQVSTDITDSVYAVPYCSPTNITCILRGVNDNEVSAETKPTVFANVVQFTPYRREIWAAVFGNNRRRQIIRSAQRI